MGQSRTVIAKRKRQRAYLKRRKKRLKEAIRSARKRKTS